MAKRRKGRQPARLQTFRNAMMFGVVLVIGLIFGAAWLTTQANPSAIATRATATPVATPTMSPDPTPTATVELVVSPTSAPGATVAPSPNQSGVPPTYGFEIINSYPHDPTAFTQGLVFEDGILYEGTGLRGQSSLRKVELESGTVTQALALPFQFFGEGITIFGDEIIQLTWQSNRGFVYDKNSFELLREFNYPTEGWGLTHDGQQLIMSDGTSNLYFLNPETFEELRRTEVRDQGSPIRLLNELEYVNGEVFANVWQTTRIARISPETGQVLGWIELAGLLTPQDITQRVDVLNGIAYDAAGDRLFVTGKWWPKLFEIKLIPLE